MTRFYRRIPLVTFLAGLALLATSVRAELPDIVAYDNGDIYPSNTDNDWPAFNGGFGYGAWTPLSDGLGGGTYMSDVDTDGQQIEGSYSFGLYAGTGSYDISRPLTTNIVAGEFDVLTRFDLAGSGPNQVSIRSGNNTSSFGGGELLSFGLVNNNELSYFDGSGFHVLASGDAIGEVWSWGVNFDASAGTYTLSVTNLGGGFGTTVSGTLETNDTSVGSFAVINTSSGSNQNLIFDTPTFSIVPEPSTVLLVGIGLVGALALRRRKF